MASEPRWMCTRQLDFLLVNRLIYIPDSQLVGRGLVRKRKETEVEAASEKTERNNASP